MPTSSGTVTFLFTDIERSTHLWQSDEAAMRDAVAEHDAILRSAIDGHGGSVFSTMGDGVAAVFPGAGAAIAAAQEIQMRLHAEPWRTSEPVRVRIGLHSGEADVRDGDYFGTAVNRAARIMAIAHGGQVVCSTVTAGLAAETLPANVALRDLGEHRLRDLASPERIHQVVAPRLENEFPPLRSLDTLPGNLPIQPAAFVGREREVKELAETILSARVVTLTGVGGVGKSRLALQSAAEVLPSFRDGAWLVELAGVGSADAIVDSVAAALGVPPGGPFGLGGLQDQLRTKQLLLILDNCEHLLSPVSSLVDQLVRRAPDVRIVATSREGLGVEGEQLWAVASMELPEPEEEPAAIAASDAVRLFVERAREASATYRFTEDDAPVLAELCRRLDGIPLAIELAAARVPALTPTEIAAHLDRRFTLLTGGRRAALPRHQTLRNAIEWSYQLLDPEEQVVLERLSVFAGGFDLMAAQTVAASEEVDSLEVLDTLARLVAKSLVVAEPRGTSTRYRLLETVRDFAWEHLGRRGEIDRVARSHAEFYAGFAREAGAGLRGSGEAEWRERIESELGNLRAALSWAIAAADTTLALQPVADFSFVADRVTPYGLLAEQAARVDEEHPLAAVALAVATFAAGLVGDIDRAQRLADEAWSRAERLGRSPDALWVRCRVANATCSAMAIRDDWSVFGRNWLTDARELRDEWSLCEALTFQTGVPDDREAVANGEEALRLARRIGNPTRLSFAAILLAGRLVGTDPLRAESLLSEAAETAAVAHNDWIEFSAVGTRAVAQLGTGDDGAACETVVEAMERWAPRAVPGVFIQFAAYLACLFHHAGDDHGALVLAEWCDRRGGSIRADNGQIRGLGAAEFYAYRDELPATERDRAARVGAAFDESGLAAYARERLAKRSDLNQ